MPDYASRLAGARQLVAEADLDGLLLAKPENLYYFTGFWGAAPIRLLTLLIPRDSDPVLIVPKLEEDYAAANSWVKDVRVYKEFVPGGSPEDPVTHIAQVFGERNLDRGRIGLEFDSLPASPYRRLLTGLPEVVWTDGSRLVTELRMIKSDEEIAQVRGACRLVDQKSAAVAGLARPGKTELELGICAAYEAAAESSFLISPYNAGVPVVATGPRSALPHGRASLAVLQHGDLLVVDLCAIAVCQAYHAGFTRTFSIGQPGPREREIYQVVLDANLAAIDAVRPGVTAESIDHAARDVIQRAGYGEQFTHRTGRSVGLDVSEPPYLRQGDRTVLQPGMTIVIEPGIYITGFGGVRIEDTVLVTENGHERLTRYPRELVDTLEQEVVG